MQYGFFYEFKLAETSRANRVVQKHSIEIPANAQCSFRTKRLVEKRELKEETRRETIPEEWLAHVPEVDVDESHAK